jgi:hypothetical protein
LSGRLQVHSDLLRDLLVLRRVGLLKLLELAQQIRERRDLRLVRWRRQGS